MDSDEEKILQEVRDHAAYWHSDRAKRITVEKHLKQKGMKDVEIKIDDLIRTGKLILIPQSRGEYLKETEGLKQEVQELFVEYGSEELKHKLPMLKELQTKTLGLLDEAIRRIKEKAGIYPHYFIMLKDVLAVLDSSEKEKAKP